MSRTPPFITRFDGMRLPSTDFNAVRNDTQIEYLFYELDLTNARSIAAASQLTLPLKGNSLYIDQASDVGNATIVFHDQSLSAKPGKVFVQPGFNASIPFDVLTFENAAQPGKVLRLFYGVDIDFKPGISAQVQISGNVSVIEQTMPAAGSSFVSVANLTALTPLNVLAAASNTAGVLVRDAAGSCANLTTFIQCILLYKASAPVSPQDGVPLIGTDNACVYVTTPVFVTYGRLPRMRRVPSGMRLDFMSAITDTPVNGPHKFVSYDIL